jgi:hypothetical protein
MQTRFKYTPHFIQFHKQIVCFNVSYPNNLTIEIFKTIILTGETVSHMFKREINIERFTERDAEENIRI